MCTDDGQKWLFASAKGNLFMMLHIIGTMMGTGMARAVFIKTAKAEGMFGGVEEDDTDNEEDEKDSKKKVEPKKTKWLPKIADSNLFLKPSFNGIQFSFFHKFNWALFI